MEYLAQAIGDTVRRAQIGTWLDLQVFRFDTADNCIGCLKKTEED